MLTSDVRRGSVRGRGRRSRAHANRTYRKCVFFAVYAREYIIRTGVLKKINACEMRASDINTLFLRCVISRSKAQSTSASETKSHRTFPFASHAAAARCMTRGSLICNPLINSKRRWWFRKPPPRSSPLRVFTVVYNIVAAKIEYYWVCSYQWFSVEKFLKNRTKYLYNVYRIIRQPY
jgi:hypothetical protein